VITNAEERREFWNSAWGQSKEHNIRCRMVTRNSVPFNFFWQGVMQFFRSVPESYYNLLRMARILRKVLDF